ncbi:DNA repair and recombination protein rad54b [Desmophyllum pertusum]|uniref:DNA repair and recombination protein rad54b n=1 Tax=Desmophyllum pertusum TaxID=174260 RepID=A0A9W9Z0K7_9CNID|nr:DNA repair and recombination protein rad54b [Desmophyllum pertusum]
MFLYECVMGLRNFNGNGAILADDMGLGKTLQCISLIWTLHKQGMYGGHHSVKRTLIITPGSLVKEFMNSPLYPVMIISYEMFLRSVEEVRNIKFGLVICDEAHRLKNTTIKTATMISGLKTKRRILLTGTPVQNDLKGIHSLVDVCNPGILGTQSCFRRLYEEPIVHGQQPDATSEEKLLGQTRAAELNRLTSMFFLRRTSEVNSRYLPPKVESVVFCRPSLLQLSVYRHLLTSRVEGSRHLVCIGALKKLCNDPSLIYSQCQQANEMADSLDIDQEASVYEGLDRSFPESYKPDRFTTDHSGKLQVLSHILAQIYRIGERVTLDLLQKLCENRSYDFLRLDGKTPTSKRQSLVDRFNDKHCKIFVFLLSSKAGGVGLNLIGASRLVLFDIDWNPANDIQSMARVWRDGQKNTVHIYRLLTTGTIEEKIYQRQTAKQGLSGTVADAKESVKIEFSRDELKDLFTLHENTLCLTHDLLQCTCLVAEVESDDECQSEPAANQQSVTRPCQLGSCDNNSNQKNLSIAELMDWQHYPCPSVPGSDFEAHAGVAAPGVAVQAHAGVAVPGVAVQAHAGVAAPGVAVQAYAGVAAPGVAVQAHAGVAAPGVAVQAHAGVAAPGVAVQAHAGVAAPGVAVQAHAGVAAPGLAVQAHSGVAAPGVAVQAHEGVAAPGVAVQAHAGVAAPGVAVQAHAGVAAPGLAVQAHEGVAAPGVAVQAHAGVAAPGVAVQAHAGVAAPGLAVQAHEGVAAPGVAVQAHAGVAVFVALAAFEGGFRAGSRTLTGFSTHALLIGYRLSTSLVAYQAGA